MEYKDKPWSGLNLKIYTELVMGVWRRQVCWVLSRYKLIIIGFIFSLLLWTLVGQHSDHHSNNITQSSLVRNEVKKKVKDIPDFDYKYEADKNLEYSDNGAEGGDKKIKETVNNYIQSHQNKLKSDKDSIKESLLISSNLEEELPSFDLQPDSSRNSQNSQHQRVSHNKVVDRRKHNSLNGVQIQLDESGN